MNRRDPVIRLPRAAGRAALWALGAALAGLLGCSGPQARLQSDDEGDRYGVKTVGDVTKVGNANPVPLGGVGLVEGLDGTGAEPAPDNYRTMLENDLRKALKDEDLRREGVRTVGEYLRSNTRALVVVTAQLPPGANPGDPLDVEVTLPPRSKAKSLRGGCLRLCRLFEYEYTKTLNPEYQGSNVALPGHCRAVAEGPVLVGFGDGDEAARVRRGRIWAGGRCKSPNPFLLVLNPEHQQARLAALVADRVNEGFRGAAGDGSGAPLAEAHNNQAVQLRVPPAYRLNLPHYLRVVRLIPLQDGSAPAGGAAGDPRPYRQRLAEDLHDPARAVTAALRLEALGPDSIPALKGGLKDSDGLVRFCSAESLAYLGSPAAGDELGKAVERDPRLRAFALTALASLDEAVSHLKLRELLAASSDDETRYGAFRALRALDEHDPAVQGEFLNDSFWLHRVAPDGPPLVHISSTKRAEVVLFGQEPTLKPPFSFLAGEFAVTATQDDEHCTVSRFPLHGGPVRRQCSLKLEDVLRLMADLGGSYPEVIELLQQAHQCQCLSCRVRCDALPQAVSVYDLAASGKARPAGDGPAAPAADLGATPTLYDAGRAPRAAADRNRAAAVADREPPGEK